MSTDNYNIDGPLYLFILQSWEYLLAAAVYFYLYFQSVGSCDLQDWF